MTFVLPAAVAARSVASQAAGHLRDPRNWVNKWRIAVLTFAIFAALC